MALPPMSIAVSHSTHHRRRKYEMTFGQSEPEDRPDRTADRDPARFWLERRLITLRHGLAVLEGLAARDRDAEREPSPDLLGRLTRHRAEIAIAKADLAALAQKHA